SGARGHGEFGSVSLVAEDVYVTYPPAHRPGAGRGLPQPEVRALAGVSMALERGRCVAVVGPNGAGKSTLLAVMTGQLRAQGGRVLIDGRRLEELDRFALARRVAVVEQNPVVPPGFTVAEVVAMGRTPHLGLFGSPSRVDGAAVESALAETGLGGLARRPVEKLSGGESQRVVLARALAQEADHLLLDEPTNHLDLRYQLDVLRFARRAAAEGTAVLLVLHDLNLAARVSDRVLMLQRGAVVADGEPGE